jgi:hypothetical protein
VDSVSAAAGCRGCPGPTGAVNALSVSHSKSFCVAIFCGRAGLLTGENGGCRLGQLAEVDDAEMSSSSPKRALVSAEVELTEGSEVILVHPCVFHSGVHKKQTWGGGRR